MFMLFVFHKNKVSFYSREKLSDMKSLRRGPLQTVVSPYAKENVTVTYREL